MKNLSVLQYDSIKKNYAEKYKKIGVNDWDVKDISFSINDYEGGYTIIKFDEKVKLPNGKTGQRFSLNGKRMNVNSPIKFDGSF